MVRPAKTKAMQCLEKTSPDEENVSSPSFLRFVQQSKMTRSVVNKHGFVLILQLDSKCPSGFLFWFVFLFF